MFALFGVAQAVTSSASTDTRTIRPEREREQTVDTMTNLMA